MPTCEVHICKGPALPVNVYDLFQHPAVMIVMLPFFVAHSKSPYLMLTSLVLVTIDIERWVQRILIL